MNHEDVIRMLDVVAETVDEYAVIAGGYARDRALGREPKDVDIWLHTEQDIDAVDWNVVQALQEAGFAVSLGEASPASMSDGTDEKRVSGYVKLSVCRLRAVDLSDKSTLAPVAVEVDILNFHEPVWPNGMNVLHSFDVGLCQAGYDREGNCFTTELFKRDVGGGLTLTRNTRHAHRMVAKFPERIPVYAYQE